MSMGSTSVHFMSKSKEWATPQWFFDGLDSEFHFTLDPCATHDNAKCPKYYTLSEDGLDQSWKNEVVFMNPPYGRQIGSWIAKAMNEAKFWNATVVCLIPAKTETQWWALFWDYDNHKPIDGCEVRFIFKRLQFNNCGVNAPFPCAVVIFRPRPTATDARLKKRQRHI